MGKFLFEQFKVAKLIFEEASEALSLDIKKLCFDSSESDLSLTENTQVAILTVSVASLKVLESILPLELNFLLGHSVGEYGAFVAADTLAFSTAVKAVRRRGQLMQSSVPVGKGGMLAVLGLSDEEVTALCNYVQVTEKKGVVTPANFNSPGQVVISGEVQALDFFKTHLKFEDVFPGVSKKIKCIVLNVSAPFHSPLMEKAEVGMSEFFESILFKNAKTSIIQNKTAKAHWKSEELKINLIQQISSPVLWTQSVSLMKSADQIQNCIECGAGTVLKGLLKKIDSNGFRVFNMNSLEEINTLENYKPDQPQ